MKPNTQTNSLHSINLEQGLYIIKCGTGYTCLGFDFAHNLAVKLAEWLKRPELAPTAPLGTAEHWSQYGDARDAANAYCVAHDVRCPVELDARLIGLERKRVEVTSPDGGKTRFWVGKSTGWMPCHLAISRRTSRSGGPAYIPTDATIRVVS